MGWFSAFRQYRWSTNNASQPTLLGANDQTMNAARRGLADSFRSDGRADHGLKIRIVANRIEIGLRRHELA